MAMFGRQQRGPTVRGRALVVPHSTADLGCRSDGNASHVSAMSRVRSSTLLVAQSADDGRPVSGDSQRVKCTLPNWLVFVMNDGGSGDGGGDGLPAELHVPVFIDAATRHIVDLDVSGAEADLEPYRSVGTREWAELEAHPPAS